MELNLKEDKRGDIFGMMANLLFLFMMLAVFVAMIPALNSILGIAQQSNNLNCNGYTLNGNPNATLSYNASLASDTISCMAIRLYLPYITLAILIGGVSFLLRDRMSPSTPF